MSIRLTVGHIPWCHSFLPRTTHRSVCTCVCVQMCHLCETAKVWKLLGAHWRHNWFEGWLSVDCPRQKEVKINDDKRITAVSISVRLCGRDEQHSCTCSSDSCAVMDFRRFHNPYAHFYDSYSIFVYVTFERFRQTFLISWSHISFVWFRWRATPFASEHTFPCALSRTNTHTHTQTKTETETLKQTSSNESIKRGRYFAAARHRCQSYTFILSIFERSTDFSRFAREKTYNRNNRRIVCVNPSQLSDRFFITNTFILKIWPSREADDKQSQRKKHSIEKR